MESLIRQRIDEIAECIFEKIKKPEEESFGLYSGEFGQLLFLFYYSKFSQDKRHAYLTEKYAGRLFKQFIKKEKLHTFCTGFSGILYLFEFLRENDFIDMDVSNIQPKLDHYIVSKMRQDIQKRNYDFMHGALGVGLYFLKKGTNPKYIQELIEFLYSTAEQDTENHIFKWESFIMDKNEERIPCYNFALSHGISSIIIFLARVVKSGISDKKITEMLSGVVNYLLSQEKDFLEFGSCFPNYILINSPVNISKSRMAWCYGDLGTGVALWQAGEVLEKPEWKEKGLEILLKSTKRKNYNESYVIDAGICHGSAGIAMIFRRIYLETKNVEFKYVAQYWIKQTLSFSRFEDGLAGYKKYLKDGWDNDYSLLMGISGIGLILLSYLENDNQEWDEMFLL